MIEKILSPVGFEIWKLLDNPEDWCYGNFYSVEGKPYNIFHKDTHVCLWISNGRRFLEGYGTTIYPLKENGDIDFSGETFKTKVPHIGSLDRHILWHKVSKVVSYLEPTGKYSADGLLYDLRQYNEDRYLNENRYLDNELIDYNNKREM
nr:MAG: hypothetical protein [Caudoviricetes sp.]